MPRKWFATRRCPFVLVMSVSKTERRKILLIRFQWRRQLPKKRLSSPLIQSTRRWRPTYLVVILSPESCQRSYSFISSTTCPRSWMKSKTSKRRPSRSWETWVHLCLPRLMIRCNFCGAWSPNSFRLTKTRLVANTTLDERRRLQDQWDKNFPVVLVLKWVSTSFTRNLNKWRLLRNTLIWWLSAQSQCTRVTVSQASLRWMFSTISCSLSLKSLESLR